MMYDGRCDECDSRYCWDGCNAGDPGYAYVVGRGWRPLAEAEALRTSDRPPHRIDWPKGHPRHGEGVIREVTDADIMATMAAVQISALVEGVEAADEGEGDEAPEVSMFMLGRFATT